jgi:hypothetical protein
MSDAGNFMLRSQSTGKIIAKQRMKIHGIPEG